MPGRRTLAAVAVMVLLLGACSARKQAATDQNQAAAQSEAAQSPSPEATPAAPSVTVHIGYAHREDYLQSLSVAKFASATEIPVRGGKAGVEVVRFEGGEPVWEIAADRGVSGSLLGHMPGVEENKKFALTEVSYGVLPKGFTKEEPQNSDPEPLEVGKYYIFTVRRASGPFGYQAVHITADGTIESYEAEPRAGTSYALCCNVAPDFTSSATSDSLDQPGGP